MMNWEKLKKYFDQTFDFLGRVTVSESPAQKGVVIHPLIKLSTGLTLKTIASSKTNRLVVLLPNRLHVARWISTFCALGIMCNDYNSNFSGSIKFSKGQKLLVNNRVVEFEKEEFSPYVNQQVMWVKCSDGRWAIPLDRKLEFEPAHTNRRLSSLKNIKNAYYSAVILDDPIDTILQINAQGNRTIFQENLILVSKIGETSHFIHEHSINNSKIVDLFQWGKLDISGDITTLTPGQIEAHPSCLIASELYAVGQYFVEQSQKTRAIIIDGVAPCVKDLQILDDDILSQNIPTIIIADFFDTENLSHLTNRDFKVWQWHKDNISQSKSIAAVTKESPFSSLNRSLTNYSRQQIVFEPCEHPQLSEIVGKVLNLDNLIGPEDDQLKLLYGQMWRLVNELSRLIWLPDQIWTKNFHGRVQHLKRDYNSQKLWLQSDIIVSIDTILAGLLELAKNPFPGTTHKTDKFHHLIDDFLSSEILVIVVPTTSDAESARQYWSEMVSPHRFNQLHFLAVPDISKSSLSPTQIIVCGWLNYKRMYPLLHLHVVPKITTLLYPFETMWFKKARKRWDRQNNYKIKARDFSGMLKLPEGNLDFVNFTPKRFDPVSEENAFDIIDFEIKIRRYRYSGYVFVGGDGRDEAVKATTVVLAQNHFAFVTETHRHLIVTDLMRGKTSRGEIPRKTINQLRVGDYVLFRESDRDIIREIADQALVEQGLSHLRKMAHLWQEALQRQYETYGRDLDRLILLLWEAGCEREPSTIKNWLFDEDQIGPKNEKDTLERIAGATGNIALIEKMTDVVDAIQTVRRAHFQASRYITDRLLANLSKILDSEQGSDAETRRSAVLDLDDFGQITILRVEEISSEWKEYETKWVNRLLP